MTVRKPASSLSRPAWAQQELGPSAPSGRPITELVMEATEAALDEVIWILRNSKWDSLRARTATTWLSKAQGLFVQANDEREERRSEFESLMAEMRDVPAAPVTELEEPEEPLVPLEPPVDAPGDDPAWRAETVATMDPWA